MGNQKVLSDFLAAIPPELREQAEITFTKSRLDDPEDPIFAMSLHLLFLQKNLLQSHQELKDRQAECGKAVTEVTEALRADSRRSKWYLWTTAICQAALLVCAAAGAWLFVYQKLCPPGSLIRQHYDMAAMRVDLREKIDRPLSIWTIPRYVPWTIAGLSSTGMLILLAVLLRRKKAPYGHEVDTSCVIPPPPELEPYEIIPFAQPRAPQADSATSASEAKAKQSIEKKNEVAELAETPVQSRKQDLPAIDFERDIMPLLTVRERKRIKRLMDKVLEDRDMPGKAVESIQLSLF